MRERIERLLGYTLTGDASDRASAGDTHGDARPARYGDRALWVSTFHSACARLLRRYGDRVGL